MHFNGAVPLNTVIRIASTYQGMPFMDELGRHVCGVLKIYRAAVGLPAVRRLLCPSNTALSSMFRKSEGGTSDASIS